MQNDKIQHITPRQHETKLQQNTATKPNPNRMTSHFCPMLANVACKMPGSL